MTVNKAAIATATLWISAGSNVALLALDLAQHHYGGAAAQSIIVALISAWIAVRPKVDAWFDARLGEAIAQRRTAEIALAGIERMARAREDMRVQVSVVGPFDRPN